MKTIKDLRWGIIVLICLGTITNYLARISPGGLTLNMTNELEMSTQQYSYVVAAFQVGYTIIQALCGFIVDLIDLRIGLPSSGCCGRWPGCCMRGPRTGSRWLASGH